MNIQIALLRRKKSLTEYLKFIKCRDPEIGFLIEQEGGQSTSEWIKTIERELEAISSLIEKGKK